PTSTLTINTSACEGGFYDYFGFPIPAGQTRLFVYQNSAGCDSTVTVNVAANPFPVVDLGQDSTICEGQTLTLDAGNPGATYNWSNGATTQTINVNSSDLYTVTVTNTSGCAASNEVAVSVVVCTGTEEPALRNVSVFPNPTSGAVTIQFAELPSKTAHLTVINSIGQVVVAKQQVNDLATSLDLSGLPRGLYFLRLQSGTSVSSVRIAVQ
ncbi:MAG TPA: T9SS type A sorting domain-containing protein, partial [Saprospiraceae bacterium]|nr:T9SS type A sorting domain-containing protein [Saprospiraceae bacterium]